MVFGKGHHLHLIDGSAFIFRAYHALPPLTRKSDGLPVGAVAGFCNMLQRYVENNTGPDAPTHVAVIFDHSGKTFRNDMYDLYKANRSATPEDLIHNSHSPARQPGLSMWHVKRSKGLRRMTSSQHWPAARATLGARAPSSALTRT